MTFNSVHGDAFMRLSYAAAAAARSNDSDTLPATACRIQGSRDVGVDVAALSLAGRHLHSWGHRQASDLSSVNANEQAKVADREQTCRFADAVSGGNFASLMQLAAHCTNDGNCLSPFFSAFVDSVAAFTPADEPDGCASAGNVQALVKDAAWQQQEPCMQQTRSGYLHKQQVVLQHHMHNLTPGSAAGVPIPRSCSLSSGTLDSPALQACHVQQSRLPLVDNAGDMSPASLQSSPMTDNLLHTPSITTSDQAVAAATPLLSSSPAGSATGSPKAASLVGLLQTGAGFLQSRQQSYLHPDTANSSLSWQPSTPLQCRSKPAYQPAQAHFSAAPCPTSLQGRPCDVHTSPPVQPQNFPASALQPAGWLSDSWPSFHASDGLLETSFLEDMQKPCSCPELFHTSWQNCQDTPSHHQQQQQQVLQAVHGLPSMQTRNTTGHVPNIDAAPGSTRLAAAGISLLVEDHTNISPRMSVNTLVCTPQQPSCLGGVQQHTHQGHAALQPPCALGHVAPVERRHTTPSLVSEKAERVSRTRTVWQGSGTLVGCLHHDSDSSRVCSLADAESLGGSDATAQRLAWCHVLHSRGQAPKLPSDAIRELVHVQLQSRQPIRAPWYRHDARLPRSSLGLQLQPGCQRGSATSYNVHGLHGPQQPAQQHKTCQFSPSGSSAVVIQDAGLMHGAPTAPKLAAGQTLVPHVPKVPHSAAVAERAAAAFPASVRDVRTVKCSLLLGENELPPSHPVQLEGAAPVAAGTGVFLPLS